jgi:asparagine synthase (glutamine-hydrolysing)
MMGMIAELRHELAGAVRRRVADGLLLSGGLDSSILAVLAPDVKTFTVTLETYGNDLYYARKVVDHLGIKHYHETVSIGDAITTIPTVIKALRSFDPAIPNDLATYFGLRLARKHGVQSVMTGDGGDELFAGYDYMLELDLVDYIPRIARNMYFSSNALGKAIGVTVKQPYLDKAFIEFALRIEPELKVKLVNGQKWGKWILRKTFEGSLPQEIVWRRKTPIELGSGFTELRAVIESTVSEDEFKMKQGEYGIKFRSREHLYYYEIYRDVVGEVQPPGDGEKRCPDCGAGVDIRGNHCRVCGGFPI